ncbi:MAG TPA: LysE family translocator [Burkholderiaceae bacterium]|nr:LysE family translocator [Burkholderiaceae bacterium]
MLADWLAVFAFLAAGTITPGANTAVSTVLGVNYGVRGALPFIVGVTLGFAAAYAVAAAGLAAVLSSYPLLRIGLLVAGTAYMIWLAWKIANTRTLVQKEAHADIGVGAGLLNCLLNAKIWMLAITAMAQTPHSSLAWHSAVLAGFAFNGLITNLVWAWVGAQLRDWLATGRRLVMFNRAMALALIAVALWLAWKSLG